MPKLFDNRKQMLTFLLFVFYTVVVYLFDADELRIRYIYVAFGILIFNLLIRTGSLRIVKETGLLIGYLVFGVMSLIWTQDAQTSFTKIKGVFLLLVFLLLATTYLYKTKKTVWLTIAIGIGSVALSFYFIFLYGGLSNMADELAGSDRIGDLINNVNAIGISSATGMVVIIGLALFYKKRWMLLFLVPTGICLIGSGSRTATISFLVGIVILVLLWSRIEKNLAKTSFRVFIAICITAIVILLIIDIPAVEQLLARIKNAFSVLTGREVRLYKENSAQSRLEYITLGWKQFLKSPLWGNGIGCAGYALLDTYGYVTYLHNNYIEVLTSGGLIGFLLFYTPYYLVLKNHVRRILRYRENNPTLYISFSLLIARLVSHMGTVVYYSKIEYILLAIWISTVHEMDGSDNIEQRKDPIGNLK